MMNFEAYCSEGHRLYAAFVEAIRHILQAAVAAHELVPHAITGRAKAPGSLGKKLDDRGIDRDSAIDEVLKDLAGVRIVFLTNGAVDAFARTGILYENFEVLNVNVHHPVPGTETEATLFDSTHYLVGLRPERLTLPEYKAFEGLRCEIQVQTLLNHAWAEMGHDTIYKQPQLDHVGEKKLAAIKARMDRVMRDYLLPAGHDFDKIARDFQQLLAADRGVPATLETLATSRDNDALLAAVGTLDDLILPHFDLPCPAFLAKLPTLIDVVERTRGTAAGRVETAFGHYPGKSGEDVARKVARLIADLRYCDPIATFAALVRLYSGAVTDAERKIWGDLGTEFAKHNLDVWQARGAAIPHLILDQIDALDAEAIRSACGLLIPMLGHLLAPEIVGMTATSTTVTTREAFVAVTDEVTALRARAMGRLEQLLDDADGDAERQAILDSLRKAGTPPFNGANPALLAMVMGDAARVTAIERVRIAGWGLELRRRTESSLLRRHHRFHGLAPHVREDGGAVTAHGALMEELDAVRSALAQDSEFARYKALVGHDSVRPDAWEGDRFDPEKARHWRATAHQAIVDEIDAASIDAWVDRIRAYLGEPRAGDDHLMPFADAMKLLGQTKPDLARVLLDQMDGQLAPLLKALLLGIDAGGGRDWLQGYIARWSGEGRFLRILGDYLRWQTPFDLAMLGTVSARAIELGDEIGVMACLVAASVRFEAGADPRLIDDVFMPGVGYIARAGRSDWVDRSWGFSQGALLAALDEAQLQLILDSVIGVHEISYATDMLLAAVAERYPGLVLDFFERRIQRGRGEDGARFDAIPFSQDLLNAPLAAHPALVVGAARRWYDHEPQLHEFRGGRLLQNVFPKLDGVADPLRDLAHKGDREDIAFVLATLLAYDGATDIYPLCMDIVALLGEGDPLLGKVVHVLGEKGVMTGEFGYVEAEGEQRKRLEAYRDDPRAKVQSFAREQLRQLAQSMAWEQRRAVWDVEQRKRDWGEA